MSPQELWSFVELAERAFDAGFIDRYVLDLIQGIEADIRRGAINGESLYAARNLKANVPRYRKRCGI